MRSQEHFDRIKNFVHSTFDSYGNTLRVDTSQTYTPGSSDIHAYCTKYYDQATGRNQYDIVSRRTGNEELDLRVLMHEYGHVYLGHLDEIHQELDEFILSVIETHRLEFADKVNESCGIDFGEELLDQVIYNPEINHMIHNISEDLHVNDSVLSKDDIDFMMKSMSEFLLESRIKTLELISSKTEDDSVKAKVDEELKKLKNKIVVKYMTPSMFGFPEGKTYSEYIIMLISNLDKFVKLMAALKLGDLDNDISNITAQQIQQALGNSSPLSGKSQEYQKGYRDAVRDAKQGQQGNPSSGSQQQGQQGQQGSSSAGSQQQGQSSQGGGESNQGQGSQSSAGSGSEGSQQQGQAQCQQGGSGNEGEDENGLSDYQKGYQDGLRDAANGQGQGTGNGQGGSGMSSFKDLLDSLGITDPGDKKGEGRDQLESGENDYSEESVSYSKDHGSSSRQEADVARDSGNIVSAGHIGCSKNGRSSQYLQINPHVDEVDVAIKEVLKNVQSKVIAVSHTRNTMWKYNKGILRSVIVPSYMNRVTISNKPKLVFLIDVSGSMDTRLINRVLVSISKGLKTISRGLKFDIIAWNTDLEAHFKDIDPTKGELPKIPVGGGTSMANGMRYFKDNYTTDSSLIVISDFEDNMDEWRRVESTMTGYKVYGWNYGRYARKGNNWKNLKQRNFSDYSYVE